MVTDLQLKYIRLFTEDITVCLLWYEKHFSTQYLWIC